MDDMEIGFYLKTQIVSSEYSNNYFDLALACLTGLRGEEQTIIPTQDWL